MAHADVVSRPLMMMRTRSSARPLMTGSPDTPPPVAMLTPGTSLRSEAVSLVAGRLCASAAPLTIVPLRGRDIGVSGVREASVALTRPVVLAGPADC